MASPKKSKKKSKKKLPAKLARKKTAKRINIKSRAAKPPLKKKRQKKASQQKKASASVAAKRKSPSGLRQVSRKPDMQYPQFEEAVSGVQSGDLQGISKAEGADSESVDELLEEGNPFEAGVVEGVEEADDADQREVHTHEMPEDDVPDEYLDKD
jgi:hypothetical protein